MSEIDRKESQRDAGNVKCTFQISVCFQRNSTWQGTILWMEKNETQNFRSMLEMLKLMDEALLDGGEISDALNWASKQ